MLLVLLTALVVFDSPADQQAEKQVIATIAGPDLKGGIVLEITWDGGTLLIQGVFAKPGGELAAHYIVIPANGVNLERRDEQTASSLKYWKMKASRVSPTGLGRITSKSDSKMRPRGGPSGGSSRSVASSSEVSGSGSFCGTKRRLTISRPSACAFKPACLTTGRCGVPAPSKC